MYNTT